MNEEVDNLLDEGTGAKEGRLMKVKIGEYLGLREKVDRNKVWLQGNLAINSRTTTAYGFSSGRGDWETEI